MIEWINDVLGISNEVSVPTLISIIVFVLGGTINFLFNQLKSAQIRKTNRKTFILLLEYVIKDLKSKEKNVENLKKQFELAYEGEYSYTQKPISYLETLFEFDFKDMFYSFRKKFFWSINNRNVKYKAFHKVWETLRELDFFETKIYDHLQEFTKNLDERIVNFNSAIENFRKLQEEEILNSNSERHQKDNFDLLNFFQEEQSIWLAWLNLGESRTHYYYSYTHLVFPLLQLNRKYGKLKVTLRYAQPLVRSEHAYEEVKRAVESYRELFTTYHLFYRNRTRLLKRCLIIIK
ncbi:hypothetical protein [Flavobacterium silvaticum]|uniref:Uncharacterized protein n=1 Tax=Flavobacterium silvaticum TaxID=1852020 RepID=A0A972FID9_9FLAO|nr:hypothetical protein [Flavobacterium silvaticum]NMH26559.1 hypothetical protein [Flavobacterium silvaticum]